MTVKSLYYKLPSEEFRNYLARLKNSPETEFFLADTNHPFFYCLTQKTNLRLKELSDALDTFDRAAGGFSDFAKNQLVQSFLLDEIESTNSIESIFSTRHDIFSVMNRVKGVRDKKLVSVVNSYELLLDGELEPLESLEDVRGEYDRLLGGTLSKEDKPDGRVFRREPVFITDGIKTVHSGIIGEAQVEASMEEFLQVYNAPSGLFEKMIIAHFLIETIHPFYDGNGRFGRYLFSREVYRETGSLGAFLIAKAFCEQKTRYYAALKEARDEREFGCLNDFVENIASLLAEQLGVTTSDVQLKKERIAGFARIEGLTKSERKVFDLMAEASVLSDFGVSNSEIQKHTGLSKRTVISAVARFREQGLLSDTKIGYYTYHKLKRTPEPR